MKFCSILSMICGLSVSGCYLAHDAPERDGGVVLVDAPFDAAEPPAPSEWPEACEPGAIQTRWISSWDAPYAAAAAQHGAGFFVAYPSTGEDGHVERIGEDGRRAQVATLPRDREVVRYQWLVVRGALWLARWSVSNLRAGPLGDAGEWLVALDIPVPRFTREVAMLDADRLVVLTDQLEQPLSALIVDLDGRVLRPHAPLPPDSVAWLAESPGRAPTLVRWRIEQATQEWVFSVGAVEDAPRPILRERCEGGISSVPECTVSILELGEGTFALAWRSRDVSFLERHEPGQPVLRVEQPPEPRSVGLWRAPGQTLLQRAFEGERLVFTLLDEGSLAPLGSGELRSDGALAMDGSAPYPGALARTTDLTAGGAFLLNVAGHGGALTSRWALGRVCPL